MTPWNAFFDMLLPDVPGCPQASAVIALRQAAISFCEQSLAWREEHPDITVTAGTAKYLFQSPGGSVVHAITFAEFNDSQLETRAMERDISIWDRRHKTGTPEYILGGQASVTLAPTPDVDGTLKMIVALKPSPNSDGIDDNLFAEYREAVVHGALSKLMLSPKKPYTDIALAGYHSQLFLTMTACAGVREVRNFNRAPLMTEITRRRI